ncbi:MAG: RNA-guided endonuclease InsQ/TnpB family protein [Methanosarcinaceae archaeon]
MMKSYKFRIYPNKNQSVRLISTLNTCRHLYNDALAERKQQAKHIKVYKEYPIYQDFDLFSWGIRFDYINYYDQQRDLPKNKTEYQKKEYGHVLQNVLRRAEKAYNNFFGGSGYPRFQGRNRYDSFTYPDAYGIGYKITDDGKLKLSKIGEIKIVQHRKIEGKIKTCTIKRDVDSWYVSFSVEMDAQLPLEPTGQSVGVDVGLKSLITLSNGKQVEPPKFLRQSDEKLTKAQRDLSRKKKGSNNRDKQRIEVARIHRHIRNQRKDFAHKLSRTLVNTYDTIVFEKLQIMNMVKNHHLAKSISDAGWGQLVEFTKFKAEWAGRVVQQIDPKQTSMECCICGSIQKMPLSQRTYNCPSCDNVMDRDENAAKVIKSRAIGQGLAESTPVEMFSRMSLKQEAPCESVG